MNLDEALRLHRVSLDEIDVRLRGQCDVSMEDTVFVAGSLVEGIGNARSDVDVFVVAAESIRSSREPLILRFGGLTIDVETQTLAHVDALITSLERQVASGDVVAASSALSRSEVEFLHRVCVSRPLQDAGRLGRWKAIVRECMPTLIVRRALVSADGHHVDCVGAAEDRDWESAALMAQHCADSAADALLAATGCTSEAPKWRMRRLRRIDRGSAELGMLGGGSWENPADEYLRLTLSKRPDEFGLRRQVFAAVQFANRVLPWAARVLSGEPQNSRVDRESAQADPTLRREPPVPLLRLDVSVRYAGSEQYVIGAIEAPGGLIVNSLAADAICQFDGRTPHDVVVARVVERCGSPWDVVDQAVRDLACVARFRDLARSADRTWATG